MTFTGGLNLVRPQESPADGIVTEYYCDLYYDPFKFMRENNKKYGWVMSMYEFGMSVVV